MAGQTYAAYPRHDNYARSAGFNVSATDIQTVRMIDKAAQTNDYVVLTDQALAAAAVDQLGFKHYYHGDIFFYPIPTGGTLYQYYLQMVEQKPSLDIIKTVTEVTGAPLIFFAIHDYWWRADQIAENTKLLTDHWWSVNNQAVTIFCFSETNLCP
jgi:hypothetical protein